MASGYDLRIWERLSLGMDISMYLKGEMETLDLEGIL